MKHIGKSRHILLSFLMSPGARLLTNQHLVSHGLMLPTPPDLLVDVDLLLAAVVDSDGINQLALLKRPHRLGQPGISLVVLLRVHEPSHPTHGHILLETQPRPRHGQLRTDCNDPGFDRIPLLLQMGGQLPHIYGVTHRSINHQIALAIDRCLQQVTGPCSGLGLGTISRMLWI